MEERKHIDRLYQEKFKDFEASPREAVWKNISSKLKEKERKRTITPIWYRMAGVAAVLALFFNFATDLFKTTFTLNSQIATTERESGFGELNLTSSAFTEDMTRASIILQALMLNTQEKELQERASNAKAPVINNAPLAVVRNMRELPAFRPLITIPNSSFNTITLVAANTDSKEENSPVTKFRDLPLVTGNENDFEEIKETNAPLKKLRVTTTAAPIYFDNMGSGSSIDARFANNESSGEVSMAYGINLAYQISEKLKLRSGISKVDLSHNTRNIAFTAAVNPSSLTGIDYRGEIPKYSIENSAARPFSNISASTEFNRASLASPTTGFLNQRLGFIEVPIELEYVIIDRRIGLNIIGGGSTLFLDENMVSLNAANFSTNLGRANNLNSVSFSTNIGIGVDYKISPQFQLNLEPIFKYQINTFTNGTDLNPYFFGIYSGFSFKF